MFFGQTTLVGSKVVDFGKQFKGSQQKNCDCKITAIWTRTTRNQHQGIVVKMNTDLNVGRPSTLLVGLKLSTGIRRWVRFASWHCIDKGDVNKQRLAVGIAPQQ